MSKMAVLRDILTRTENKGLLVVESIKIYPDVRGGCTCGGKFSGRVKMPAGLVPEKFANVEFPSCCNCGQVPSYFLISAVGCDSDGLHVRYRIRNNRQNKRLNSTFRVLEAIEVIDRELKEGVFDYRHYASAKSLESYKLKNYLKEYEAHNVKRLNQGQITPNGLRHKRRMWKHLVSYFGEKDIGLIKKADINIFRRKYEASDNTKNKVLSEFRTILKFACGEDVIKKVPEFGNIPKSKERLETMSLDEGLRILEAMKDVYYKDIVSLLTVYPVRPCEVVALKWRNLNLFSGEITFDSHISHKVDIKGRKSRKIGEKYASLTLPLTEGARAVFEKQVRDINQEAYIFKGRVNDHVSLGAINDAWRAARHKVGIIPTETKKYHMYEFKHAVLSEMNKKVGGNLKILEQASGVDIQTLMKKYVYASKADVASVF